MVARYPSLARRRQVAKVAEQDMKQAVEESKAPEGRPVVEFTYAEGLLPDVPGRTHGIVCVDPWTVQCDQCGFVYVGGKSGAVAIILSGTGFLRGDPRRLCADCIKAHPWSRS